jgi:hypothetical protein
MAGPKRQSHDAGAKLLSQLGYQDISGAMNAILCILLVLASCGLVSAQNDHPIRNIVLVHGAWADGFGWKGVNDIFVKDGFNVTIVNAQ